MLRELGPALVAFSKGLASVFVRVWEFLRPLYDDVLRPFISWSWTQVQRLHTWLVKTFGPLLKHLRQLREWILRTYDKWFKPIFATIDMLRAVLRLLETFHVPFAQAIDRKLADLEARLLVPIRFALTKVNELIGWIDRIVTLDGLFQRLTYIESLWHYTGDAWNVLLKHQPAGVSREQNAELRARKVIEVNPAALRSNIVEYYTTGGGEFADRIRELAPLAAPSTVQ